MTQPRPVWAVFDCMVYLQAAISQASPAEKLFEEVDRGNISLFVSKTVLLEIRDVLTRPIVSEKYPHLTSDYVDIFLNRVLEKARFVRKVENRFDFIRDPKDEKYLNLAITVEADYVVTRDRDLLDLMTGIDDESKEFRQRFRRLKIVDPVEMLKTISENKTS
ncbi:MAG: putative toxin-antitoxin system toxin component, PIN family [Pyrinomonadaceae bacterium]